MKSELNSVAELIAKVEDHCAIDDDPNLDDPSPLWITSSPGQGKTALLAQLAKRNNWAIEGAQIEEESDLVGIPDIRGDRTKYMKPDFFYNLEEKAKEHEVVILFIDEAAKISPRAHKPFYTLINEKQVYPHEKMPDNVRIILASNLVEHGAMSDQEIPPAVKDRVGFVQYNGPTTEEWVQYAASVSVHPVVTSFITENGHRLTEFDVDREDQQASPRSWTNLGKTLSKIEKRLNSRDLELTPARLESEALMFIPVESAKALVSHYAFEKEIPKLAEIVADPENTPVPTNISANFYLSYRMAHALDKDNAEPFTQYMDRNNNTECKLAYSTAVAKMGKSKLIREGIKKMSEDDRSKSQSSELDSILAATSRTTRR